MMEVTVNPLFKNFNTTSLQGEKKKAVMFPCKYPQEVVPPADYFFCSCSVWVVLGRSWLLSLHTLGDNGTMSLPPPTRFFSLSLSHTSHLPPSTALYRRLTLNVPSSFHVWFALNLEENALNPVLPKHFTHRSL